MSKTDDTSKLWGGRFSEATDSFVQRFTASVNFDQRMAFEDIAGSLAHARMLTHIGVLSEGELAQIEQGLAQIGSEIEKQIVELGRLERRHAIHACSQMITGDMVGLTNSDWSSRIAELESAEARLKRLHVVPHRRWANGFSCFAFAMIGIPVALRLRTSNYATTFGICFLPILIVYYPLFMFGLNGAKMGTLPPYAAWLGDLVCVAIGGWLMYREFRR
jgi:hypothetical protein